MRRSGVLAFLLVLNACAIVRPTVPASGFAPVPADSVVLLAPGTRPSDDASTIEVFAPSLRLEELSDTDLLKHYAPRAGQLGANHVSLVRMNGRRMVRAYYLRIPNPVAAVPADSVHTRNSS